MTTFFQPYRLYLYSIHIFPFVLKKHASISDCVEKSKLSYPKNEQDCLLVAERRYDFYRSA